MMQVDTSGDVRFSRILPGLQVKVNSSSLGPFKKCPRYYYYTIVRGYEAAGRSVHLTFGTLIHKGIELYDLGKIRGLEHEINLLQTIEWALRATWNNELNRPWQSGDSNKNRLSLVRTLVWYLDKYGPDDSLATVILSKDKPALELDFEMSSGYISRATGEEISFIGKLDKLVALNDSFYVKDVKTTGFSLGPSYFENFSPDNQFSLYSLAGKVVFNVPVRGLILDAIQIGATFSRFDRAPVARSDEQLDEWLGDSQYWLRQMEICAVNFHWPMNDKACQGSYGRECEFRKVCSMRPGVREQWLDKTFVKKTKVGQVEDLIG